MTPRSLFVLILRVLGILSLKEVLISVPQLVSIVTMWFRGFDTGDGLFMIFLTLISVVVYMWVAYTLIFKAGVIVRKFGLDQDFTEETFLLNISMQSVLRIAIIVTGALVLFFEIPELCKLLYQLAGQQDLGFMINGQPDWSPVVVSAVKILLALLLIGERNRMLTWLTRTFASNERPAQVDDAHKDSE